MDEYTRLLQKLEAMEEAYEKSSAREMEKQKLADNAYRLHGFDSPEFRMAKSVADATTIENKMDHMEVRRARAALEAYNA